MEHNKINEAGYNEASRFGPSENNPPMEQQTENEKGSLLNTQIGHRFIVPEISKVSQEPFSIAFYYEDKSVKIQFKKSEDILKLGELLSKYLTENGIENTIETTQSKSV